MTSATSTTTQYINNLLSQNKELTTAVQQLQTANNSYVSIVEKTNNQLGMWSNPYGVMVSTLSALFTILAIFITIIIWWISRDNRKIVKEQLNTILNDIKNNALSDFQSKANEIGVRIQEAKEANDKDLEEKLNTELKNIEDRRSELETQIKLHALNQAKYMKEEDYLCKDCIRKLKGHTFAGIGMQADSYSLYEPVTFSYASRTMFPGMSGSSRHCIKCGKEVKQ